MARIGLPYWLSFVIRSDGTLLDGTSLERIIATLGADANRPPRYAVNCVLPCLFHAGLTAVSNRDPASVKRIQSFQANTSKKSPEELNDLKQLDSEESDTLAESMLQSQRQFGTVLMGGCCGTDTHHIESLARQYKAHFQ